MDLKTFFDNFETIANAPGGIARLRELILDLAVEGKLVTQLDSDGSAQELIEKIEAERQMTFTRFSERPINLPVGWEVVCLGELCHLEMGQSPDSDSYNQGGEGLPFYQGKTDFGVFSPSPRYWCSRPTKKAYPGDVLLSVRAPVGPTNFVIEESCIGRGLAALRPLAEMETKFLLWWLRAYERRIAMMGTGTTFIAVSKKNLQPFPVRLPPLAEQRRIVAKIDELMALCDELKFAQNQRDSIRASTRNSAIDAISTATTPEELDVAWKRISDNWLTIADTPASIASLRALIHDVALSGAFGGADTWRDMSLGDISKISYGYTESANRQEVGPKFLRITDIQNGVVDWDQVPFCVISKEDEKKQKLESGDIVFARTGATTGKSHLLVDPPRSVCASYLIRLRPDREEILPEYLSLYFQSGRYWLSVRAGMSGTAQGGFNSTKLGSMSVLVPALDEQEQIIAKVQELTELCNELERSLLERNVLSLKIARAIAANIAA